MVWMVNVTPWPFYSGNDKVPIVQEVAWSPGPVWTGAECLARHQNSTVQPLASSMYRLNYRGPKSRLVSNNIWGDMPQNPVIPPFYN